MKSNIEPKPTTYRNILFRSRLEARWAVVLDNCTNILTWKYEPITFTLPKKGWEYTPDFQVVYYLKGEKKVLYVEVKPMMVTPQYAAMLMETSNQVDILCCMGSFYDGQINTVLMRKEKPCEHTLASLFEGFNRATDIMAAYRFDLEGK